MNIIVKIGAKKVKNPSKAHGRNVSSSKIKSNLGYRIMVLLVLAGAAIMLLPFYWMTISTFKTPQELLQKPPTWFPTKISFVNFVELLEFMPFFHFMKNSLIMSVVNTVVGLLTSSLAGYIFAKFDFKGKNIVFFIILGGMMIPYQVVVIPLFIIMNKMSLINTFAALTLPYFVHIFGIFMMRQFMLEVPDELIDAAEIDGCGQLRTFLSIVLPISKSSLSALFIILFLASWDSFIWPIIAVNSKDVMTLPVALNMLVWDKGGKYALQMTAAFVAVLPMVVVFTLAQKRFIEGIALSGMKA